MHFTDFAADFVKRTFHRCGLEITRHSPADADPEAKSIMEECQPFTLTSPARIYALIQSVRFIVEHDIPGDFVECGVWKGGSMMAAALTLQSLQVTDRKIHLFDTFSGMSPPGEFDVSSWGASAANLLKRQKVSKEDSLWCKAPIDLVRKNLKATGYPLENVNFIPGKVEDTLPAKAPDKLAILRLDTDWYESTRHELIHLYPLLSRTGVLIVDDYGSWLGARKAVDEYFEAYPPRPLLHRIDDTGRVAIKT